MSNQEGKGRSLAEWLPRAPPKGFYAFRKAILPFRP